MGELDFGEVFVIVDGCDDWYLGVVLFVVL